MIAIGYVCRNVCDIETLTMRRPDLGCSAREEKSYTYNSQLSNLLIKITYIRDVTARHSITSSACTARSSQRGTLLLLSLRLCVSSGLLNSSLPRFSIHSRLIPILNFIFPRSTLTSSSHPNLGLPILTTIGLHSATLFTVLPSSILTTCQKVRLQCIYFGLFSHF